MKITLNELEDLEVLGEGTFGKVYKKDNFIFKVFKERLKTKFGVTMKNTSLSYFKSKYKLSLKRSQSLKFSTLLTDKLYVDGKLIGLVSEFKDGVAIKEIADDVSYMKKYDIVNMLIRNAKELTDNRIYPLDYHLYNVLYDENSDEVNIIDLNDIKTRYEYFSNKKLLGESLKKLKETIVAFYSFYPQFKFDADSLSMLESYNENNMFFENQEISYNSLSLFNEKKLEPKKYLFIRSEDVNTFDLDKVNNLINNGYRLIIDFSGLKRKIMNSIEIDEEYRENYIYEECERIIRGVKLLGYSVYDIIMSYGDIEKYTKVNNTESYFVLQSNRFIYHEGYNEQEKKTKNI